MNKSTKEYFLKEYEENKKGIKEHGCSIFCHHQYSMAVIICTACKEEFIIGFGTTEGPPTEPQICQRCKDKEREN